MRFFILFISLPLLAFGADLEDVYQWKFLDYDYPNDTARQNATIKKEFIEGRPLALDVDVHYNKTGPRRIFVSSPSLKQGVPATLATVTDKMRNGQNLLAPYPNWTWHINQTECKKDRIVSVFKTQIDECGRIWVLDSGRFEDRMVCRPQLLAFNLTNDKLVYRHEFNRTLYDDSSYFVTPLIDVRKDNCNDTFAYIADAGASSLIVHNAGSNRTWMIKDRRMYPDPVFGTFNISGQTFQLMHGILGMSLEPYDLQNEKPTNANGQGNARPQNRALTDRKLFFHALTSNTEHYAYTGDLMDERRFINNTNAPDIFTTYTGRRSSQSGPTAISKRGYQYFGQARENAMYCWNIRQPYGGRNIKLMERDNQRLQFNSGLKIVKNNDNKEELWIMTNRLQKAWTGTTNTAEVNFRIMKVNTDDIVCEC